MGNDGRRGPLFKGLGLAFWGAAGVSLANLGVRRFDVLARERLSILLRVMLMEKAGWATYYIQNDQGEEREFPVGDFLTPNQENDGNPTRFDVGYGHIQEIWNDAKGENVRVREVGEPQWSQVSTHDRSVCGLDHP